MLHVPSTRSPARGVPGGAPPLIAVTTSEMRAAALDAPMEEADPPCSEMALGLRYLEAIAAAGAIPVVVVPVPPQRIEALLDRVDGLCLSGGPDIHPSAYSRAPHPDLGPTEPRLDGFELQLARAADRRGMPILGICRGAQLLNVARSGTLHQHLPEIVGTTIAHRQPEDAVIPTHTVDVAPHTLLAGIAGSALPVNSSHHQAVDELGAGLVPVAWAPDGTIEAIEATDRAFVLGVQWHAECLTDRPEEAAIFSAFADACEAEALPMLQTATG